MIRTYPDLVIFFTANEWFLIKILNPYSSGANCRLFYRKGCRIIGCDISDKMIQIASKLNDANGLSFTLFEISDNQLPLLLDLIIKNKEKGLGIFFFKKINYTI